MGETDGISHGDDDDVHEYKSRLTKYPLDVSPTSVYASLSGLSCCLKGGSCRRGEGALLEYTLMSDEIMWMGGQAAEAKWFTVQSQHLNRILCSSCMLSPLPARFTVYCCHSTTWCSDTRTRTSTRTFLPSSFPSFIPSSYLWVSLSWDILRGFNKTEIHSFFGPHPSTPQL